MKKYKLLEDVPYHKAGETLNINQNGDLVFDNTAKWSVLLSQFDSDNKEVLNEWVEEIPEEPKTVYDLKDGDQFFSISSDGVITTEQYRNHTRFDDDNRIAIGNAFLTKEETEKELAWLKAREILKQDTKGFKPDWGSNMYDKWEVVYEYSDLNGEEGEFFANDCNHCCAHNEIWFATRKDAMHSITAHPQEWKTYLGVEE